MDDEKKPFAVRSGRADDAKEAARIIGAALGEYGLPFEPEGRDADVATFGSKPDARDFVAEMDGRVVGVASVGEHGDVGVAWVSKLFVEKQRRGLGIGRALLGAAHDAARAAGCRTVGLRTRRVFIEALRLYAAEGYAPREDPRVIEAGDVVLYRDL